MHVAPTPFHVYNEVYDYLLICCYVFLKASDGNKESENLMHILRSLKLEVNFVIYGYEYFAHFFYILIIGKFIV